MHRPWYRTADMLPQINAWCEVRWIGREFRALRMLWANTKTVEWATLNKDGSFRRLPPSRFAEEWGEHPLFYRPLDAATWRWPLPPPVVEAPRRMWSSTGSGRFSAMSAQAEQSAKTVEGLRAEVDAEYGAQSEAVLAADGEQSQYTSGEHWWRDANNVIYEEPGNVSPDMAEARILRFVAFVGAGRQIEGPSSIKANARWLADLTPLQREMLSRFVEVENAELAAKRWPRLVETGNDHRDWDEAGRWFLALNPPQLRSPGAVPWSLNTDQRLLVWRSLAPPMSWSRIGKELGRSREDARRKYGAALVKIHCAANGRRVVPHVSVDDCLAALRERNRLAKLRDAAYR